MIDIKIPEPSIALNIPAATPASLSKGHELMAALRDRSGGKTITNLKSYREVSVLTADTPMGAMDINLDKTVVFPDRMVLVTKLPFGEQTQVVTSDGGWAVSRGQTQDMTADQLEDAHNDLRSDTVAVLKELDRFDCQALEPTQIDGTPCQSVYVTPQGSDDFQIFFLDAATGLVKMVQSKGNNPMTNSPSVVKVYVDELGDLAGMHLPTAMRLFFDDDEFGTISVKDFQANPKVDAAVFTKK